MSGRLSFTGYPEAGKLLVRQAASCVQKVSLEPGGDSPFVDDADVEQSVRGVGAAKFRAAGQICTGANRVLSATRAFAARFTGHSRFAPALTKSIVANIFESSLPEIAAFGGRAQAIGYPTDETGRRSSGGAGTAPGRGVRPGRGTGRPCCPGRE